MATSNAELSNDELVTKLEQALVSTAPQWRAVWQGSAPQRGWSIAAGRDTVAYLGGDEAMSESVERIVEAHNSSFTQSIVINPQLLMDLALPDDMSEDDREDLRVKVFGVDKQSLAASAVEFERLARKLGWAG